MFLPSPLSRAQVVPGLFIGSAWAEMNEPALTRAGITDILQVRHQPLHRWPPTFVLSGRRPPRQMVRPPCTSGTCPVAHCHTTQGSNCPHMNTLCPLNCLLPLELCHCQPLTFMSPSFLPLAGGTGPVPAAPHAVHLHDPAGELGCGGAGSGARVMATKRTGGSRGTFGAAQHKQQQWRFE